MRSTVGGVSVASREDDYEMSFQVEGIDIFLSHSWAATWYLKYLTLLFYFNGVPATAVAMSTAMVLSLTLPRYVDWYKHESSRLGLRPVCLTVGSVIYIFLLFTWHNAGRLLRMSPSVFLDKVCIHQTDASKKVAGIKSIGGFLARSKLLLVLWDKTYFERLWCTYEVAAFKKTNARGKVRVVPVVLGGFVAAYIMATLTGDLGHYVLVAMYPRADQVKGVWLYLESAALHLPFFIFCSRVFVRYVNNLNRLKEQFKNFQVRSAYCFCCNQKHIHPDTKEELPCDRQLVYESIAYWYDPDGLDKDTGLNHFDEKVRGDFGNHIKQTMGGYAKVPYRFAVAASVFAALDSLDFFMAAATDSWLKIVFTLDALLLRHPINIALLTYLVQKQVVRIQQLLAPSDSGQGQGGLPNEKLSCCSKYITYTVFGCMLTILFLTTLLISGQLIRNFKTQPILASAWIAVEIILVAALYFGRHFRCCRREAHPEDQFQWGEGEDGAGIAHSVSALVSRSITAVKSAYVAPPARNEIELVPSNARQSAGAVVAATPTSRTSSRTSAGSAPVEASRTVSLSEPLTADPAPDADKLEPARPGTPPPV